MPIRKPVQFPSRHIHILGEPGYLKPCQLSLQSRRMVRLNTRPTARTEKGLQSFMAECLNHISSV